MFKPNTTVAAVIERDGRFLVVEEMIAGQLRLNQPAGHLEQGESLIDAVIRETLEETAHHFVPTALTGIYQWSPPERPELTYLRFTFTGEITGFDAERALDEGIVRAVWLTQAELAARAQEHRSPLLNGCIRDYLAGQRYALALLHDYDRSET
ncbi:NUDIX hydrolase [Amantichitinum ursilacus]|uniref:Phosphatase NudJ n=1 Tax=Amantichitinum ursilacus TaxID=857265 RepID=A0A0N0GKV3_9NEIS|nr:NUDIX hydrolase [Amantichitinum ursilacus]KPC49204.1 Phosphatase NudJ [Amantichitinum ursilacus]